MQMKFVLVTGFLDIVPLSWMSKNVCCVQKHVLAAVALALHKEKP